MVFGEKPSHGHDEQVDVALNTKGRKLAVIKGSAELKWVEIHTDGNADIGEVLYMN